MPETNDTAYFLGVSVMKKNSIFYKVMTPVADVIKLLILAIS
jgi:hypothetical protein